MANGAMSAGSAEVAHNLADAAKLQGETHAGTHVAGGAEHAEPAVAGVLTAGVFVSLAMAAFIAILVWKKVPGLVVKGLDKQISAIRARLEEAQHLRAEAEALRDEYARRIANVEQQAAEMIAHADEEAKALVAKAEADAAELVKRRTKMAEDKIAAAERAAINAVRAKAADAAAKAAATIIAEKHDASADKALVDKTIAGLNRLN